MVVINKKLFKFMTKELEITEKINDKVIKYKSIIICIKNTNTGIEIAHPLSLFIKTIYGYRGLTINTQVAAANSICRFLNYCMDEINKGNKNFINLKKVGLKGLTIKHGSLFLTNLSISGRKKNTVMQYDRYLNKFYIYLLELNLINEKIKTSNTERKAKFDSIFKDPTLKTRYPSNVSLIGIPKLKDFGEDRYRLVNVFINIARNVAPEIAFGICLQFFGGLRRGEIVNITRADLDVEYRRNLNVKIRDNRDILFNHLKDTKFEFPKRINYLNNALSQQIIITNDLLWTVYKDHIEDLDRKIKQNIIKNNYALFLDKNGNAMSGKVYERRFKKVKIEFLKYLCEINHPDYDIFVDSYWGTHIGRGIYTNILFDMGMTSTQIAIARGDRNTKSSMDYVDYKKTYKSINNSLEKIEAYIHKKE